MAFTFKSLVVFIGFLWGCSGLEISEKERIRKANLHKEVIYRNHDEIRFPLPQPQLRKRKKYPWEKQMVGTQHRITKEYFRCNGNSLHSPRIITNKQEEKMTHYDCGGVEKHSLPVKRGKEFIYPILIDLLNYLQEKTGKRTIITCGHRCPARNLYSDPSVENQYSKHLIGAEVDFYVEGMEENGQEVVNLLMDYYYQQQRNFGPFYRYEKKTDVSTLPWYNKEIFIKFYQRWEGRDEDNCHPFPYISIQVRLDRETKLPVTFTWQQAFNGYLRS